MLGIVCEPAAATEWNERAMELARTSEDPGARRWRPTLANNMGWALHDAGAYEQALARFREALHGRVEQGDGTRIRIARWCVARCLRSLGRVDEALTEQESLAAELAAAGATDGYVTEERAECLLALGRAEEARPLFAQAHAELSADAWLDAAEPERLTRLATLGGL
jgi:tetratricopeptide (TPR) repeat protein